MSEAGVDGTAALCQNGITPTGFHCTGSTHVGGILIHCTDPSHKVAHPLVIAAQRPTFGEVLNDPMQQIDTEGVVLQAVLSEQERDRLRAEGWRSCVDHIRRKFNGWLSPEDTYWVRRQNPYLIVPAAPAADVRRADTTETERES